MTCYRDPTGDWLRGEHTEDCPGSGCVGCLPCLTDAHGTPVRHCDHCRGRAAHLLWGENTCPGCIGKARDTLHAIEELYAGLPTEAVHRGVASEAANLYGPAANAEAFSHRRVSILAGRIDAPIPEEDEHHPLAVLGRWVFMLGEDYGDPTDLRLTISRAVDFLDKRLHRVAHDDGQDFGLLAAELRRCRTHLEEVLHDGKQIEHGTRCPMCGDADLLKDYGAEEDADRWVCPRCRTRYTDHDYRAKVGAVYVLHAAALTASQIRDTYRVPEGSVRGWATLGKVRKRGKDESGRLLYDVADVLAMRDGTAKDTAVG